MFAETMTGFAGYLNSEGYYITPDKIKKLLMAFNQDGMDCTDISDLKCALHIYYCRTPEERKLVLPHLRYYVLQKNEDISAIVEREENELLIAESRKNLEMHTGSSQAIDEKIRAAGERIRQVEKETKENADVLPVKFTKKEKEFLEKKKTMISKIENGKAAKVLEGGYLSHEEVEELQGKILKMAEESLKKGKTQEMKDYKQVFDLLKKTKTAMKKEASDIIKKVANATAGLRKEMEDLQKEQEKEEKKRREVQSRLNRLLEKRKKKYGIEIVKPCSANHREIFKAPRNAVRTLGDANCPPEAERQFNRLTREDKITIARYIRDNILKFKTRMTRNITEMNTGRIDMAETVRNACRTGGSPFVLYRERKKPGKTNLILILDVSGSCKEASEMMLTFMYLLKEVFPRGCKAYAFVNTLYDITGIMSASDAEKAIEETLNMIPSKGVYSDYEKPLKTIYEKHMSEITKDSIVIMIGDARNNKNGSAEHEFKNIARRAKRMYWLNTDATNKWGHGDSIAPLYRKYCTMFEARTPKDIVNFINYGMR